MDQDEIDFFLGETLDGRYRLMQFLGEGNFSGAFHAVDGHTTDEVAVKILKVDHCASADSRFEFAGEVELLRKLAGCDRVVQLHDSGTHSFRVQHTLTKKVMTLSTEFAVIELAVTSLDKLLLHGSTLDWPDRLRLFRDVVKGVHQMHLRGIVHRDVKAANALIFAKPTVAKIADLGRAHDTSQTPRFAEDEYLAGRGDLRFAPLEFLWLQGTQDPDDQARADLYLLGTLLFEVGTGLGLTSMIVGSPLYIIRAHAALPEADRAAGWKAALPALREATRPQLARLAGELPPVIRDRAVALTAMLTDPDPARRMPNFAGGRRRVDPWDLQWLLERVDGLRRAIDPALRESYLATRPHGRSRPRHGTRKP